jgi:hypothetical protein
MEMDMCLPGCRFEVMLQCCCGKKKTELELETAVARKRFKKKMCFFLREDVHSHH